MESGPRATKWGLCTVNTCIWVIYQNKQAPSLYECLSFEEYKLPFYPHYHTIKYKKLDVAVAVHFSHLINLSDFETLLILVYMCTCTVEQQMCVCIVFENKINASLQGGEKKPIHKILLNYNFKLILSVQVFDLRGKQMKTHGRLMNNQMSLTFLLMFPVVQRNYFQPFDVQFTFKSPITIFQSFGGTTWLECCLKEKIPGFKEEFWC